MLSNPATQILDDLLGSEVSGTLLSLDPDVLAHTRSAAAALYADGQSLTPAQVHGLAAVVAQWHGNGALHAWHLAQGADTDLLTDDAPTDERLRALREHVDLLAVSPALATHEDQESLSAAGIGPDEVVLVSQLVAFESYLGRLVTALAALSDTTVESVSAPDRVPTSRGRHKADSPTTHAGSPRPHHFTQDMLDWEPWVAAPDEDDLTPEQIESFASKASVGSVYFRLISRTPALTKARSDLDNAVFRRRDGLPKAERELAAAVASKVNDCIYCASVHARKSSGFSKRPADVDRLLAAQLPRDADWVATDLAPLAASQQDRWSVLVDAAARLSQVRPTFDTTDVQRLRAAGLPGGEVVDLATATAFFAWANRLMLSLGEAAQPQA